MELLKLVETDSLEKIKEFLKSHSIPSNSKWLDYTALNSALEFKRKDVAKLMLEKNFRVNRTGRSATAINTPLHHAAKMEDVELVNSLLLKKASVVALNEEGETPLHLAFMSRNDPIVDLILSSIKNAKVTNPKNKRGLSHFHIACIRNNQTVVQYFLKSGVKIEDPVNTDSLLWPGYTALHFAVEFNCFHVTKLLLDAGANRKAENANGQMPFALAKNNFTDTSMLNYYLTYENENLSIHNKLSHFHVACMKGDAEVVESFISNGAAVNNKVSKTSVFCPSYSPLHFAVESNDLESVKLLVEHGSDPEIKNGYYMTPLHLALYNEDHKKKNTIVDFLYSTVKDKEKDCTDLNGLTYFHIAVSRNDTKLVKKLLDQLGEDANGQVLYNLKNFSHYTPLHFAARYSCVETAELLIKKGANINRNDNGMHGTPLHLAYDNGDNKMIELLLKNGGDVNAIRPYDDKTMLHIFVEQVMDRSWRLDDPMKVVAALDNIDKDVEHHIPQLVKAGCNVNAKDTDGNTALHIACSNLTNGSSIVKILLELGADINLENNEGDTPFNCTFHDMYRNNADDYMAVYHHVQKLKDLGMTVNPKNEKCCEKLLREREECDPHASCFVERNISKKHQQRLEEIEKMKKVKVDKSTSLYQVLFEDLKKLSLICKNNEINKVMEQKNFRKSYPWYGSMLQLQYQKGLDNLKTMAFDKLMATEEVKEPRAKRKRR